MTLNAARSEAARVAARVDLRDVRLFHAETSLGLIPDERRNRLGYSFDADLSVQHDREGAILLVLGDYSLVMHEHSGEAEESDEENDGSAATEVASIKFQMNALFEVETEPEDEPFSESEMTAFGQTTGMFALYPYAREFIADMTGRMGLPPLHMGVMRLGLDSRNGD